MANNSHSTVPRFLYDYDHGDRYIVEQTLGSGTFGTVVKAKLMRNAQFYAIKVMNSSDLQSFDEEVSVLTQMQKKGKGQHIIPLVASFVSEGRPCLVFPLMKCSLLEFLEKEGNPGLPWPMVVDIGVQILHALRTMEEEEYVHGDLKLENIMVKSFDRDMNKCEIVVIDLGLSCKYSLLYLVAEIQSLWWRAPEITLDGCNKTKMDIWSVGCCLAELLTGEPLFKVASDLDLLTKIVELKGAFSTKFLHKCEERQMFFRENPSQSGGGLACLDLRSEDELFELFGEFKEVTGPRFGGMDLKSFLLALGGDYIRKDIGGIHLFLQNLLEVDPGKRWDAKLAYQYISRLSIAGNVEPSAPGLVSSAEGFTSALSTITEVGRNGESTSPAPFFGTAAPIFLQRGVLNANGVAGRPLTQAERSQPLQSGNGFSVNDLRGAFPQVGRSSGFIPELNTFGPLRAAVPLPLERGVVYSTGEVGGVFSNPAGNQPAQRNHFRGEVENFPQIWRQERPLHNFHGPQFSWNHLQTNPNPWSGHAGSSFNRAGTYSEAYLSGYNSGYAKGFNEGIFRAYQHHGAAGY